MRHTGWRPASNTARAVLGALMCALALPLAAGTLTAGGTMHPSTRLGLDARQTSRIDGRAFHCQTQKATYQCYGPDQMRAAYDFQPLLDAGTDGSGRTIAIVDAFQDPTLASDVKDFDKAFGLNAPSLRVVAPFGTTPFNSADANQVGWSGEIALDVEWAHAMAPGAAIVLALAPSDADSDLIATERYVVDNRLADVMSMSFGEAEQCMAPSLRDAEDQLYAAATDGGMSIVAAAGDQGSAQLTCDGSGYMQAVSIPASDPNVTAVGGTDLGADLKTGAYESETVWNEPSYPMAGGGGYSTLYSKPAYQSHTVAGGMRGLPDVAYSASNAHGVVVAWGSSGYAGSPYWIFAGTSVGTPQWAALAAIADQAAGRDLGNIDPQLYAAGGGNGYHDVVTGDNAFQGIAGYSAGPGWDAASGLGSPDAGNLVSRLTESRHSR